MIKRIHGRRPRRLVDRGDILLESMAVMALFAVVAGSFSTTAIGANQAARTAQYTDVASQAAQGVIEKANSLPWSAVGFTGSETDYRGEAPSGQPTVNVPASAVTARQVVLPSTEATLRSIHFDLRTDITWRTTPALTGTGDFGVKQVTVAASWNDAAGNDHTISVSSTRSPSVNEAVPSDIANPTGDGNYVYPSLQAMLDSSSSKVQVAWTASTRYSSVLVQRATNGDFTSPTDIVTGQTAGTYFDEAAAGGKLNYYRVKAVTPNGQAIYSETQTVFMPVAPAWGDAGAITWPAYDTSQATATLQGSAGSFAGSSTVKEFPLSGKSSIDRNAVTGLNYFRIKFTDAAGASSYSPLLQRDSSPLAISSVKQTGDGSVVTVSWDRSAEEVDAANLVIQTSNEANFATGVQTSTVSSTTAKSASVSTTALTVGAAYARIGYVRGSALTWSNSAGFTRYPQVKMSAKQATASGVVTATLGSGQKLSDWAQLDTAQVLMPDGNTVALTDNGATSALNGIQDGKSGTVATKLTMKNGDVLTVSVSVTRAAGPKIISVGTDHKTITIDKSFGSWLGADADKYVVVQWVAKMDTPWSMTKTEGNTGGTEGYSVDLIVYDASDTTFSKPLYEIGTKL